MHVCIYSYVCTERSSRSAPVFTRIALFNLWIPPWLHFCWKEQEGYHHLACVNSRSAVNCGPVTPIDTHSTDHWWVPGLLARVLCAPCDNVWMCVCVCVCVDIMSRRWRISFAGRRVYGLNASVYLLIDWQKLTENLHTNIIVKNYNKMITNIKYISKIKNIIHLICQFLNNCICYKKLCNGQTMGICECVRRRCIVCSMAF